MSRIEFRNVSKGFSSGAHAVEDFSLKVEDGEFLVLLGPSGCGKSTLLRMVAGLESITSGEILLDDEAINNKSPQQRNVAMVFQNYALYPHKTVRENLAFPLRMMKLSKDEREIRIQRAAKTLGLSPYLDRKPRQLSGGQSQRVAMGRAIVRDPNLFLMDEPLSNLDAKLRTEIRTEIGELQGKLGVTTLYVTHDQVEAMTLGQRIAVLKDGRLQQVDTAHQIFQFPANTFVASFLGSPGMNLAQVRLLKDTDRGYYAEWGTFRLNLPQTTVENSPQLRAQVDQSIVMGIRPESLSVSEDPESENVIRAKVKLVEILGHEQIVFLEPPETMFIDDVNFQGAKESNRRGLHFSARLPESVPVQVGEIMTLKIESSRTRFFKLDGTAI